MELTLTRQSNIQVAVHYNNELSHTFDLLTLLPDLNVSGSLPQVLENPVTYGSELYQVLFPTGSLARQSLDADPDRLLLVTSDDDLQAIPWEYAYGPDGFIVLDIPFVRGLSAERRIPPPALDTGLHIVAVPSNPLNRDVPPLLIDEEWQRLKEIVQAVPAALTLERVRPSTQEQLRRLLVGQRHRVIHFMGHGAQHTTGAMLCFERDDGSLDPVSAKDFVRRVKGTVFLVTLNACVSATPGPTEFSNLAAALVRQGVPYALGMRFSIPDEDARTFSRVFYSDLAGGASVEEALLQARLTLADSPRAWAVGVPVLYTALNASTVGFARVTGRPHIDEHQPRMDVHAVPRAEGTFQGRTSELQALGQRLTADRRPRVLTIHGSGGQGKTALAREAVERFAWAWPGGVWAISLDTLPTREGFALSLARFVGVETEKITDPVEIERQLLAHLALQRTLLVLDNAETLIEQVEQNNEAARQLAEFIRVSLPSPQVSLLVTSRHVLSWTGEELLALVGLQPDEGKRLFHAKAV